MTNATKVCYVLFIYLITVYGWDHFSDIPNEYRNRVQINPNFIYDRENVKNPQDVFRYDHPSYPFDNIRGDLEYNLKIQEQYIQPILRQLQELLLQIKSLTMTRYQPDYASFPVPSYTKTENSRFSGDSAGPLNIPNRFPNDENDANQNWGLVESENDDSNRNWGIVKEDEANNGTKRECKCEKFNDMSRISPSAQYMNSIDSPTRCKAATLSCCIRGYTQQQKKDCFAAQRCLRSYETGYACLPVIIRAVYAELYG